VFVAEGTREDRRGTVGRERRRRMVLFDELDKSGLMSVQPMYLVVAGLDDDDIMIRPISISI
jgi:hypothetical protein